MQSLFSLTFQKSVFLFYTQILEMQEKTAVNFSKSVFYFGFSAIVRHTIRLSFPGNMI